MTCYCCGKTGYYARDCRIKNKVVQQLNMLTTGDNKTSGEWEVLTKDIGCLMEDDYSKELDKYTSDKLVRALTPHPHT